MIPKKDDPAKFCEACGAEMARKRFASGRLEDRNVFLKRRHCSQSCANSRAVIQADSHRWRARQVANPEACEHCSTTEHLHVHHKDRDVTNNAPENLMVLCSSCHLKLHWEEDRDARMASISARTRQPSSDGKRYLAEKPRSRQKRAATDHA